MLNLIGFPQKQKNELLSFIDCNKLEQLAFLLFHQFGHLSTFELSSLTNFNKSGVSKFLFLAISKHIAIKSHSSEFRVESISKSLKIRNMEFYRFGQISNDDMLCCVDFNKSGKLECCFL